MRSLHEMLTAPSKQPAVPGQLVDGFQAAYDFVTRTVSAALASSARRCCLARVYIADTCAAVASGNLSLQSECDALLSLIR